MRVSKCNAESVAGNVPDSHRVSTNENTQASKARKKRPFCRDLGVTTPHHQRQETAELSAGNSTLLRQRGSDGSLQDFHLHPIVERLAALNARPQDLVIARAKSHVFDRVERSLWDAMRRMDVEAMKVFRAVEVLRRRDGKSFEQKAASIVNRSVTDSQNLALVLLILLLLSLFLRRQESLFHRFLLAFVLASSIAHGFDSSMLVA
jgi:hypothetical protein